jgi:hypothetical protein
MSYPFNHPAHRNDDTTTNHLSTATIVFVDPSTLTPSPNTPNTTTTTPTPTAVNTQQSLSQQHQTHDHQQHQPYHQPSPSNHQHHYSTIPQDFIDADPNVSQINNPFKHHQHTNNHNNPFKHHQHSNNHHTNDTPQKKNLAISHLFQSHHEHPDAHQLNGFETINFEEPDHPALRKLYKEQTKSAKIVKEVWEVSVEVNSKEGVVDDPFRFCRFFRCVVRVCAPPKANLPLPSVRPR